MADFQAGMSMLWEKQLKKEHKHLLTQVIELRQQQSEVEQRLLSLQNELLNVNDVKEQQKKLADRVAAIAEDDEEVYESLRSDIAGFVKISSAQDAKLATVNYKVALLEANSNRKSQDPQQSALIEKLLERVVTLERELVARKDGDMVVARNTTDIGAALRRISDLERRRISQDESTTLLLNRVSLLDKQASNLINVTQRNVDGLRTQEKERKVLTDKDKSIQQQPSLLAEQVQQRTLASDPRLREPVTAYVSEGLEDEVDLDEPAAAATQANSAVVRRPAPKPVSWRPTRIKVVDSQVQLLEKPAPPQPERRSKRKAAPTQQGKEHETEDPRSQLRRSSRRRIRSNKGMLMDESQSSTSKASALETAAPETADNEIVKARLKKENTTIPAARVTKRPVRGLEEPPFNALADVISETVVSDKVRAGDDHPSRAVAAQQTQLRRSMRRRGKESDASRTSESATQTVERLDETISSAQLVPPPTLLLDSQASSLTQLSTQPSDVEQHAQKPPRTPSPMIQDLIPQSDDIPAQDAQSLVRPSKRRRIVYRSPTSSELAALGLQRL